MKRVFKVLTLAMMLMVFAAAPAFAQEECEALYKKWLDNYKGTEAQKQIAIDAGKEFIAKCDTPEQADIIKYLKVQVPKLEKTLGDKARIDCFNNAVKDAKAVNADNAFKCGKEILGMSPELVDVSLTLATIGFDKAAAATPVDTYNADAVNYAKQSIQKIEAGAKSDQYGAYGYVYKTKEYPDGKSNALGWMNYTIGYIMYNRQNQKKEALPYLYKALQYNSNVKKNPAVYQAIGDWYKEEYNRIDDERTKLAAEAKTKTDEAEKKALVDKTKEMLLLQKGYADRMIDAYARAHALAGANQTYKTELYTILKALYAFRFDNKVDGLDNYISTLVAKPMPDPSSAVTPVVETTTTATTNPSSSSLPTTTMTTPTTVSNKPTTTATTVSKPTTTTKTKTTKAPVKTTPKKKGTR